MKLLRQELRQYVSLEIGIFSQNKIQRFSKAARAKENYETDFYGFEIAKSGMQAAQAALTRQTEHGQYVSRLFKAIVTRRKLHQFRQV